MTTKQITTHIGILLSFVSLAALAQERPNILFIMADDHTAQAVGAYATLLKGLNPTPNIDKLSDSGMVFDNAFVANSICTPSRACILTGQYNHNNGVFDLTGQLAPEKQTLPLEMRKAGYQTAIIGKWHLGQEPNFDYYKVLPGQRKYFDPDFIVQGDKPWPKNVVVHQGQHTDDAITDSVLDWFRTKRDAKKPFFLCYHFNLGRVLDYLQEQGLYDNTLIIYTGDQGFWLGEKDFQDKRWAYDESQRMPFIVRYPKAIKAGTRSDAIIENIDFPALMLDYAGVKTPAPMQGRSFRSLCETGKEPADWKQAAYYRYWMHMAHHDNPGQMAIRANPTS